VLVGAVLALAGMIGAAIGLIAARGNALPAHFEAVADGFAVLPGDADLYLVGRTDVIFATLDSLRALAPEAAQLLDDAVGTVAGGVRELTFLTTIDAWIGDHAAISISQAADGAFSYTLSADIRQDTDALPFLQAQLGALDDAPGTSGGFAWYQLAMPTGGTTHLYLSSAQIVVSSRSGLSGGATSSSPLRAALDALPPTRYDTVLVLRAADALATNLIAASVALDLALPDAGYLAVGLAQPEPGVTVIDLARAPQGASILAGGTGGLLYAVTPPTSLAVVQIGNLRAWHDTLLALPWLRERVPDMRSIVDQISGALALATGIDYQRDFLSWMTGDMLFFLDAPRAGEADHLLDWGLIAASDTPTQARLAIERVGALSLRADALRTLLPDLPLRVYVDESDAGGAPLVQLEIGSTGALGALTTTLINDGSRFIVGSPYGVAHALEAAGSGQTAVFGARFVPYARPDAALTAIVGVEAIWRAAAVIGGVPIDSSARAPLPFDTVYMALALDQAGLQGARVVLLGH